MELEQHIARLEALIAENEKLTRWELKVFKWGLSVLFVIAVCAFVIWGSCEGVAFAVERVARLIRSIAR